MDFPFICAFLSTELIPPPGEAKLSFRELLHLPGRCTVVQDSRDMHYICLPIAHANVEDVEKTLQLIEEAIHVRIDVFELLLLTSKAKVIRYLYQRDFHLLNERASE